MQSMSTSWKLSARVGSELTAEDIHIPKGHINYPVHSRHSIERGPVQCFIIS